MRWSVSVIGRREKGGEEELLAHTNELEDWKEVQCYCTEARHLRLDVKIVIRSPYDEVWTWD